MKTQGQALTLVVLAAGMGSRYGGLKQMDAFGPNGENIIDYSIYDAIQAGFDKVVFVIREAFRTEFTAFFSGKFDHLIDVAFVTQELDDLPEGYQVPAGREKPWGTGHAVLVAREAVETPFAVINADDFYGRDAYFQIRDFFRGDTQHGDDYCVVGYYLRNTLSDHGTVNRGVCHVDDAMRLQAVEEVVKIRRNDTGSIVYPGGNGREGTLSEDTIVSMNIWGFLPSYFDHADQAFRAFLDTRIEEPKSELYIPTIVDALIRNQVLNVHVLPSESSWFGVTYQEDKPFVLRQINRLIAEGVYPQKLWS
ncbi:MAG: sugar phosphate nucleotidyltransferase [Saprospiraceae bacterium]|nr:sugar phosphate nucleotidyltransferase [Saprospiraceae bacterium]